MILIYSLKAIEVVNIRIKKICNKDLLTPHPPIHAYYAYIADKRLKIAVM